jgi:hypothetical protein
MVAIRKEIAVSGQQSAEESAATWLPGNKLTAEC